MVTGASASGSRPTASSRPLTVIAVPRATSRASRSRSVASARAPGRMSPNSTVVPTSVAPSTPSMRASSVMSRWRRASRAASVPSLATTTWMSPWPLGRSGSPAGYVSVERPGAKRGRDRTSSSSWPSTAGAVWSFSSRARRRIAKRSAIGDATVPTSVNVRVAPGASVPTSMPAGCTRASPPPSA